MERKILLSFLGNNRYQKCRYTNGAFKSGVVRFVQEALLEMHQSEWQKEDTVYLFLTPAAEKNNWEGAFYERRGLKSALTHFDTNIQVVKNMPSGVSEAEIWDLFETIYQCLRPNDIVYLDITNGFRSLPMLLMVLLDYAKALKNIQVKKIYYGAFEAIGQSSQIEKLYPNPADRLAPILDLTSFAALQDWTSAAADFKLYGKVNRLNTLTENSIQPIVKGAAATANAIQNLKNINSNVKSLVPLILTNRGKELGAFAFGQLREDLRTFSKMPTIIKPLTAIIAALQNKIKPFVENDPLIWLQSAKWCRDHGLIQQGITQLQEGFITWLCGRFKQQIDANFFDSAAQDPRTVIGFALAIHHKKIPRNKWKHKSKSHPQITRAILKDPIIAQTAHIYVALGALRNDINHGGYQYFTEPSIFYEKLNEFIEALTQITNSATTTVSIVSNKHGLLNLSHHPFKKWKPVQQQAAIAEYGKVTDLLFPTIDPTMDTSTFNALVETYYRKVKAKNPQAVHVMGEMTFSYALIQRLKAAGIACIASVGERDVVERGEVQEVRFSFVGFRTY